MLGDNRLVQKILRLVMDQLMSKFNPTLINNKIRRMETEMRGIRGKLHRLEADSHPKRKFIRCEECKCQVKEEKD